MKKDYGNEFKPINSIKEYEEAYNKYNKLKEDNNSKSNPMIDKPFIPNKPELINRTPTEGTNNKKESNNNDKKNTIINVNDKKGRKTRSSDMISDEDVANKKEALWGRFMSLITLIFVKLLSCCEWSYSKICGCFSCCSSSKKGYSKISKDEEVKYKEKEKEKEAAIMEYEVRDTVDVNFKNVMQTGIVISKFKKNNKITYNVKLNTLSKPLKGVEPGIMRKHQK